MKIGTISVNQPVWLAPMAGYTNLPFRLIGKKYGADLVTTEMVSAKGLYYKDKKTRALMMTAPEEAPAALQIFGSDPGIIEDVTEEYLNPSPFALIDFNAGCPAPKIVKNGDGSALLNHLDLLEACVCRLVQASSKPVGVKTRLGWDDDHIVIREAAERIERAGAACLIIHGRTREAFYSGKADWKTIAQVKKQAAIPVIVNGDIDSGKRAKEALEITGCDGVMVGRAAVGNPFVIREIKEALSGEEVLAPIRPTPQEKIQAAIDHVRLVDEIAPHAGSMKEMRKQLAVYIKGLKGAARMRTQLFQLDSGPELIAALNRFLKEQYE